MGCSRMGFDLLTKIGRDNFRSVRKRGHTPPEVWRDTLGPLLCKIIGHKPYNSAMTHESPEWACRRCCKYIPTPNKSISVGGTATGQTYAEAHGADLPDKCPACGGKIWPTYDNDWYCSKCPINSQSLIPNTTIHAHATEGSV